MVDKQKVEQAIRLLLEGIGEDVYKRQGCGSIYMDWRSHGCHERQCSSKKMCIRDRCSTGRGYDHIR